MRMTGLGYVVMWEPQQVHERPQVQTSVGTQGCSAARTPGVGVPLKENATGEGEWDPYANSLHSQLGSILGHLEILPTLGASTAAVR
jgi:hypothetical protein